MIFLASVVMAVKSKEQYRRKIPMIEVRIPKDIDEYKSPFLAGLQLKHHIYIGIALGMIRRNILRLFGAGSFAFSVALTRNF